MRDKLDELISSYLESANKYLELLKNEFGIENPLRAVIEKRIAREGVFGNGFRYNVHGIGVRITIDNENEDDVIDIELDSGGIAGFDAWRLYSFARIQEGYENLTEDIVENHLQNLANQGLICRNENKLLSHLYVLNH